MSPVSSSLDTLIVIAFDAAVNRLRVSGYLNKLDAQGRATYWSQKGKASSRSLPRPLRFFFGGTARGFAMAPLRRPVPVPVHP